MKWPDHHRLAEALMPAVLEAGRIEMEHLRGAVVVESKADCSPVTAADREAEAVLHEALSRLAPGVPVIAEESAAEGKVPAIGDTFFLVDPLDGTKEFIANRDEFTVNVGLVVNGRPRFGMIYAPARSELYMTLGPDKAVEASFSPDAPVQKLDTSYLRVIRTRSPNRNHLVALDSRSHRSRADVPLLRNMMIAETRCLGSSLKFCLLARGEADLYVRAGPTCEWDTAAGQAILIAAGGTVLALDGRDLEYGGRARNFINPGFLALGRNSLINKD